MFLTADERCRPQTIDRSPLASLAAIRIAVVYRKAPLHTLKPHDMSVVRWLRVSEELAAAGFSVDVIVADGEEAARPGPNLRIVPASKANWDDYHVVKTLFHSGYEALCDYGGDHHPFLIAKLGSVVGDRDGIDGVHFFGAEREALYALQRQLVERARYITILTDESRVLLCDQHGCEDKVLMVPTGVDRHVPPPGQNPYAALSQPVAVYIGNFYTGKQREVNLFWQQRFNQVGAALAARGIRLCVVGNGDTDRIDADVVSCLGGIDHHRIWDYHYHAAVGLVLAQGPVQHNESSKLYYYLRSGLPVVSESPVPNNHLLAESGMGYVSDFNDTDMLAELVAKAVNADWPRSAAIDHVVRHHTWDLRMDTYRRLICRSFGIDA